MKYNYRWYIGAENMKTRAVVEDFNVQNPENFIRVIEVRCNGKSWETRGLWEIPYVFLNKLRKQRLEEDYAFQAYRRRGHLTYVEPWDFPFDKKKKVDRKVKQAVAKAKPATGKAVKI